MAKMPKVDRKALNDEQRADAKEVAKRKAAEEEAAAKRAKAAELAAQAEMDNLIPAGFFPVKLLKKYRPIGPFRILTVEYDEDGEEAGLSLRDPQGEPDIVDEKTKKVIVPANEEYKGVLANKCIILKTDEAKDVIAKRIAERADAIVA